MTPGSSRHIEVLLEQAVPADVALQAADGASAATLTLTAQTQAPLAASAGASTATLTLKAQTQAPLAASAGASTASALTLVTKPQPPLAPSVAVSTAALTITNKKQVPLAASTAYATPTLTLLTTPPVGGPRRLTVRLLEPLSVRGGVLKEFRFALVAADPRVYGADLYSSDSGHLSGGHADIAVTNSGNFATPPIVRVYGGVTDPVITNQATGEALALTYAVAAGRYLELDLNPASQTVRLDDGTDLSAYMTPTSSFWTLAPGTTTVRLAGSSPNGSEKVSVVWRDAYA